MAKNFHSAASSIEHLPKRYQWMRNPLYKMRVLKNFFRFLAAIPATDHDAPTNEEKLIWPKRNN